MFWSIPNFSAASSVDNILDKESFTLNELLDDEELIQECRSLNSRLINFLRDKAQVEQLVQYIVTEAPEGAENKQAFKYPFIACEIFSCEVDAILSALADDEALMDMLFSFLESSHAHNSLLAGYFSKVVVCLMLRKTIPLMKYVQAHDKIFCQLVDLIGITSIMEILVRLVGADDHMYSNYLDVMQWLSESNLLAMIVDKLSPSCSPQVHANAAEVLEAIIRSAPSPLASKLASPSFVARIFGHATEEPLSISALIHALSVCISLLDPRRSASKVLIYSFTSQPLDEPSVQVDIETIHAMLPKLDVLLKLLEVSSDDKILSTTYGELSPPFGKHRLQIVEFIAVLLGTGDEVAENELVNSGAIKTILQLFFQYPFNNFLHIQVETILTACFYSKNSRLIDYLFVDCDILGKFLEADKNPYLPTDSIMLTKPAAGRKSLRAGYIGHITRITNTIAQLGNCNDQIQKHLQENNEWKEFLSNVLHARNEVENVCRWACGRPATMHERARDSDEDDVNDRDFDISTFANNMSQIYRSNSFDNDDADEDTYFDDESAEVVISSLRLGDDNESNLFTNSNWFAFEDEKNIGEPLSSSTLDQMEDINLTNGESDNKENSVEPQNIKTFDIQDKTSAPNGLGQVDEVMNGTSTSGPTEEKEVGKLSSMFEEDAEFVAADTESSKISFDGNNSREIEINSEDEHGKTELNNDRMLLSPVV